MFNPRKAISAAAITFALTLGAMAQAAAPAGTNAAAPANTGAAPVKIGVIYFEAAIANTNEGIRDLDSLQKKFEPKQNELKGLNDEVENLKKNLTAQQDKLSDEAKAAQLRSIEQKQKNLQRLYEDAQAEFQNQRNEVFQRIGPKMYELMTKFATDNKLAMILNVNPNDQQSPILWAAEQVNVTKPIIDMYNAQSAVPAPAANAPSATRPATSGPARKPATTTPKPTGNQ
jgi:outer membrane protein